MAKAQYKMRKVQEREMLPVIDLFPQVEYNGRKIDATFFWGLVSGEDKEKK